MKINILFEEENIRVIYHYLKYQWGLIRWASRSATFLYTQSPCYRYIRHTLTLYLLYTTRNTFPPLLSLTTQYHTINTCRHRAFCHFSKYLHRLGLLLGKFLFLMACFGQTPPSTPYPLNKLACRDRFSPPWHNFQHIWIHRGWFPPLVRFWTHCPMFLCRVRVGWHIDRCQSRGVSSASTTHNSTRLLCWQEYLCRFGDRPAKTLHNTRHYCKSW